jgi:hypothetical protein
VTARREPGLRWWLLAGTASYVCYFALLLTCDLHRPQSIGVLLAVRDNAPHVEEVVPGSPAAAAGLQRGDRIVSAHGRSMESRTNWVYLEANIHIDSPIPVVVERRGELLPVNLLLGAEPAAFWQTSAGVVLLVVRMVQLTTLVIALILAFKLPGDPLARLGAWLLASGSVFCIVFPARLAAAWRELPAPVDLVLWFPFASSLAIGAVLFTFFASFPRPLFRRSWMIVAWIPMLAAVGAFIRSFAAIVYDPWSDTPPLPLAWLITTSSAYAVASVAVLVVNYQGLADLNERRRVRVLLPGALVGILAGVLIMASSWQRSPARIAMPFLAPPVTAAGTVLLLALPLSLVYAIVRRRLFDLSMLVRQGLRYTMARRVVLSLVPLLAAMLVFDVLSQRQKSVNEIVAARRTLYIGLIGLAVIAHTQRDRWLTALDRRFFRERYDASEFRHQLASWARHGGGLSDVGPLLVGRIEATLHPRFAALMIRPAHETSFRTLAASPAGAAPPHLPASSRLVALARLLAAPLHLGDADDWGVARQIPAAELGIVQGSQVDLILPIGTAASGDEMLMMLGPKRSEEPFSADDLELLTDAFAMLSELLAQPARPAASAIGLEECPACGVCYDAGTAACARGHGRLEVPGGPRSISGRYRLERRVGVGGMGRVYEATDLAFPRTVAVKLLRNGSTWSPGDEERFRREAQIAAAFTHPNVVTVYDFGVGPERQGFLVMEFLNGSTARDELRRQGHLPLEQTAGIVAGVCSAVDAAHRRLLVHMDLKPENVFLVRADSSELVKVLDFGLSTSVAAEGRLASVPEGGGTPPYMAPEQLRGEAPVPAWDLWALAVLAYELLTGSLPFTVSGPGWPLPVGSRLNGSLGGFNEFFGRALALDPGERFPSARAFAEAFQQTVRASQGLEQVAT